MIEQLPDHVQREIYSDFLFSIFLQTFKKFFDFPMEVQKDRKEGEAKIEHAFFKWDNEEYQSFMIQILKSLEPRRFEKMEIIYLELDEVNELSFIEQGEYDLGYEVNKVEKYKMRLGSGTVIGAFNICFNKR
jgi:hypothetical protein